MDAKSYRLRVKEMAQARGFNQSSLSRAANIAFETVKQIWHDPERDVQLSTLEKLARAMQVPVTALIEDISNERT